MLLLYGEDSTRPLMDRVYDFASKISKQIAIASGTAFLLAQLLDIYVFDKLRKRIWFVAPLASSLIGSTIDTFLFFSIAFYGTGVNWIALSIGDLLVKVFVALTMLIPFKILLSRMKDISTIKKKVNA